jgi:hypothetical protein
VIIFSMRARAVRVGVVVLSFSGLVMIASGCSFGSSTGSSSSSAKAAANSATSPSPSSSPSSSAGDTMDMPTADTAGVQDKGAVAGIRLQSLIAQHSVLVADMMRARIARAPDVAQAADAALSKNTQAMASLVDNLFGTAAGQQFSDLWSGHIRYFYAYADALGAKDARGVEAARDGLAVSEVKLGDFFAGASAGRLPKDAARAAVTAHINHLLDHADAFAKGQYAVAGADYTMAYEHGYAMGGALAAALLPKTIAAQLQQPQWKLRSGMTDLLGEHVALVVAAMRAANGDAADFQALAKGLNDNTTKLGSAVESLYGRAAADQFQNLWADHVDALMAYTSSTVKGDNAGARTAQARLQSFEPALAGFLSSATKSKLGAQALAHAYNEHDRMLVSELSAYEAKDYTRAHQLSYQAYGQMFEVAGQLANAIGVTLGTNLPKGGSQTGGGGMAAEVGRR